MSRATAWGLAALLAVAASAEPPSAAKDVFLFEDFESGLPAAWSGNPMPRMKAKGVVHERQADGNACLTASPAAAFAIAGISSGRLDSTLRVQDFPVFSWRWRVSAALKEADAAQRDRDDFAARLYIAFKKRSWWPGDVRALIYVWDNRYPVDQVIPSTWAPERAKMIVLRQGDGEAGAWVSERRDVYRDFRLAFPDEEPGEVRAIAFAADTDQTGESVVASFDDLRVARR